MDEEQSCGVITYRDTEPRQYLLLLYPAGHWGSPKGHVEAGEDKRETSRRELEEETGIDDITFLPGFRESIKYTYKAGGTRRRKTVVFFLGETEQAEVELSHEHDGYAWLEEDEAKQRITYDDEQQVFSRAIDHLGEHDATLDDFT